MDRPKICHIALVTRNPKELMEFYTKVFDMEVIGQNAQGTYYMVSDGYITLALLPHKLEGDSAVGINHFGFKIDDMDEIKRRLVEAGVEDPKQRPAGRPYAEFRGCDPAGNGFDLSEHGFEVTIPAPVPEREKVKEPA